MPSPFPGMDPYLEAPTVWSVLLQPLITYLAHTINPLLPDQYAANPNERVYVVQDQRSIYPDVSIMRRRDEPQDAGVAVAVLESDPPQVVTFVPDVVRESYIDIIRVDQPGRIVATIEVLSPSNKTRGSDGRELYLTKQREVLGSRTHLMEIDLLRGGEYTVAVSRRALSQFEPWHYVISRSCPFYAQR